MTTGPSRCLLVFARAVRPGRVKTRLIPTLGAAGAARLYRRLLERTLVTTSMLEDTPIQLWCESDNDGGQVEWGEIARRFRTSIHLQEGRDLGARMHHAIHAALETASQAVLIGSDCPDLDPAYLSRAFAALDNHDVVLGPAADGGYVLIGMKTAAPRLFEDIPWGAGTVLALTRARLAELGLRWTELPELHDIDRPEDLAHFPYVAETKGKPAR